MSNRMRQLTVGAVGLAVATFGVMLRCLIFHPSSYSFLAYAATFGHDRGSGWGSPSVATGYEVFSKIAMALFYAGLVLMVAAALAWLFTPQKDSDGDRAA